MSLEKTFVMIKPDGVQRDLAGDIISRFQKKGLKLVAMKLAVMDVNTANKLYQMHSRKHFYNDLISFITSGPVVLMVWEADNAVFISRKLVGPTTPNEAMPGTIRGDYIINTGFNVIHASETVEAANREIPLFFNKDEIIEYKLSIRTWLGLKDVNLAGS